MKYSFCVVVVVGPRHIIMIKDVGHQVVLLSRIAQTSINMNKEKYCTVMYPLNLYFVRWARFQIRFELSIASEPLSF